ncbi:MAG: hypothetical protein QG665_293 [Patescibacteria group bacterium]|nr:hypothetical protein [Patescibacteria group bacterium]
MKKVIFFLLVLLVGLSSIYWFLLRDWLKVERQPDTKPVLLTFNFDPIGRKFVAEGQDLSVIEIKAIPTGTEVSAKDHQNLGEMTIAEEKDKQLWVAEVPKSPLAVSEIYAVAFDEQNNQVGKLSLPFTGATDIYDNLWKQVPFEEITLEMGKSKMAGALGVKLLAIPEDNRCPVGVECIQAGRITADLEISLNGRVSVMSLRSDEGERRVGDNYFLNISKIEPEAVEGKEIEDSDYKITFFVTKELSR